MFRPTEWHGSANVPLLACKRTPFDAKKDSFWRVKGLLLQAKRTTFENQRQNPAETTIILIGIKQKKTIYYVSYRRKTD